MSRPWLPHTVRLQPETPLAGSEGVSCHAVREHVQGAVSSPWTTVSKKQESQFYNCKEINSTNNRRELGSRSFPGQTSDETTDPANTENAAQREPR